MKTFKEFMEEYETTAPVGLHGVDIHKNPKMKDVKDNSYYDHHTQTYTTKGILHPDGSAHIFNGYHANHGEVMDHLNRIGKPVHKDSLPIYIDHDRNTNVTRVSSSLWSAGRDWKDKEAHDFIKGHRWLNHTFRNVSVSRESENTR